MRRGQDPASNNTQYTHAHRLGTGLYRRIAGRRVERSVSAGDRACTGSQRQRARYTSSGGDVEGGEKGAGRRGNLTSASVEGGSSKKAAAASSQ